MIIKQTIAISPDSKNDPKNQFIITIEGDIVDKTELENNLDIFNF